MEHADQLALNLRVISPPAKHISRFMPERLKKCDCGLLVVTNKEEEGQKEKKKEMEMQ